MVGLHITRTIGIKITFGTLARQRYRLSGDYYLFTRFCLIIRGGGTVMISGFDYHLLIHIVDINLKILRLMNKEIEMIKYIIALSLFFLKCSNYKSESMLGCTIEGNWYLKEYDLNLSVFENGEIKFTKDTTQIYNFEFNASDSTITILIPESNMFYKHNSIVKIIGASSNCDTVRINHDMFNHEYLLTRRN